MSNKLETWKTTLKDKLDYKVKLENELNKVTSEILQLKGGIQYAEEIAAEVSNEEVTEEEAQ
tara:strand:+ start:432 stop:617 length:186 start_codon:yes stop_codon:yes gene_type:complete